MRGSATGWSGGRSHGEQHPDLGPLAGDHPAQQTAIARAPASRNIIEN